MINYRVKIKPLAQRRQEIKLRCRDAEQSGKKRKEYKFRSGESELPVIELSIDDPIYRLENYRTRDTQLSIIATGEVDAEFFNIDKHEEPAVQTRQHVILDAQAHSGSGETIKPIYDELGRVRQQTEDIIISADGIVVNGNRRLCAMRELYALDSVKFAKFAFVQCSVLPMSATRQEILQLEIGLQMQPETKLPYEWTALGRAVRDLREAEMPDEQIARLMNRDKNDIVRAAKMIDSADMYLGEFLKKPNSYNLLDGTEQAFRQIATRNLGRADDAVVRENTRQFDFFVIERRDDLTDRAYSVINAIESNPPFFFEALANEVSVSLSETDAAPAKRGLSFGVSDAARPNYLPLINILEGARKDEEAAKSLIVSIELAAQLTAAQGKNSGGAALGFAKRARKSLLLVDISTAADATVDELRETLESCSEQVEILLSQIIDVRGEGS